MSNVLIVGGAGYLGHHVVNALAPKHDCTVYDALLYAPEYWREDVRFVCGDVRDADTLRQYLAVADCVIWLAAIVGDAACANHPKVAIATNFEAVKFLASEYRGPILFTSSCSVYGLSHGIADEASPLAPLSLYAETKIGAEKVLDKTGANALILRLGTLHGVSHRPRFDLVVNTLTLHALTKGKMNVFGGKQYRPLVSVRDVADFIAARVDMVEEVWLRGVYNLASENLTILEIAERVKDCLPQTILEIVDSPFEDKRNYRVSSARAQEELLFSPKRTVRDSIQEIVDLHTSGRVREMQDVHYTNAGALEHSAV